MSALRSLPIIMPKVPGQRWSCHSCGDCCRSLVGHLFDADRDRLDQQGWADQMDVSPYVKLGRGWALNKRADGACVFLNDDGLCRIHAELGEPAKPLACRIFPFSVRRVRHGWQASLRFDCPSVLGSNGKPIEQHRAWLSGLVGELGEQQPNDDDVAKLSGRFMGTVDELGVVVDQFSRWLGDRDINLTERLMAAARISTMLDGAKFNKVRDDRFVELVELLFSSAPSEGARSCAPPTARQHGLLRQLAFAHLEHVSLADLKAPFWQRLTRRWSQLRMAGVFLAGRSAVPKLPALDCEVEFEAVDSVGPSSADKEGIDDLMTRYLMARLSSRTVWGAGYYGFGVFQGLAALWLSIAVVGWIARYFAASRGAGEVNLDDTKRALSAVDRAATRLPSLGATSERTRITYLMHDDGIARLVKSYALIK